MRGHLNVKIPTAHERLCLCVCVCVCARVCVCVCVLACVKPWERVLKLRHRTFSVIPSVHSAFIIRETARKMYNLQRTPLGIWSSPFLFCTAVCFESHLPLRDTCYRVFQKPPTAKCSSSPDTCRLYESASLATLGHMWSFGVWIQRPAMPTAVARDVADCAILNSIMTSWCPP